MYQPKCCEYANEDNSVNTLSDKHYEASFQIFKQIVPDLQQMWVFDSNSDNKQFSFYTQ